MAKISDGVVVGSAVVDLIKLSVDDNQNSESTVKSCLDFISQISNKIKRN